MENRFLSVDRCGVEIVLHDGLAYIRRIPNVPSSAVKASDSEENGNLK